MLVRLVADVLRILRWACHTTKASGSIHHYPYRVLPVLGRYLSRIRAEAGTAMHLLLLLSELLMLRNAAFGNSFPGLRIAIKITGCFVESIGNHIRIRIYVRTMVYREVGCCWLTYNALFPVLVLEFWPSWSFETPSELPCARPLRWTCVFGLFEWLWTFDWACISWEPLEPWVTWWFAWFTIPMIPLP